MNNDTWQSTGYRYGYNGKEKDGELHGEGNSYDYGARMLDVRAAKFLSVDPLASKFPWYTPYQFAGNKPIRYTDRDGLEEDDSQSFWDILFDAFKEKFEAGAIKVGQGAVMKAEARSGTATYETLSINPMGKSIIRSREELKGSEIMVEGLADMYVSSADNAASIIPIERAVTGYPLSQPLHFLFNSAA